jgi:hypothetical protein
VQRRFQVCRQLSVPQGVEDGGEDLDRVAGRFGTFDERTRPREGFQNCGP